MLAAELKKALEGYDKATLVQLATELYRKIPKKEREAQGIDTMINDFAAHLAAKKAGKSTEPMPDITTLMSDVSDFLENCYQQNYMVPNRYVHKKDRPKWRFLASGYIKQLRRFPVGDEAGDEATQGLTKIYHMLVYASMVHLFVSTTPFTAVGIDKSDLADVIFARILEKEVSTEGLHACMSLLLNDQSGDFDYRGTSAALYARLKTTDMKEAALQEGLRMVKENMTKLALKRGKGRSSRSYDLYYAIETHNLFLSFLFDLKLYLEDADAAVRMYKLHQVADSPYDKVSKLLQLLEKRNLPRQWLVEYAQSEKALGTHTPIYAKTLAYVRKTGTFPERTSRVTMLED